MLSKSRPSLLPKKVSKPLKYSHFLKIYNFHLGTETQLILLNSVKAVAESLAGLINSTRINSNHQFNPQVIDQLRQLSTGTVFSITKLVKTVQIVRDDQLKGPTALKSTISVLQNKSEVGQNSVLGMSEFPETCQRI